MKRRPAQWLLGLAVYAFIATLQFDAVAADAVANATLPGMSWEALQKLPRFTGSRWIPGPKTADERAYLLQLQYPPLKPKFLAAARAAVKSMLNGDEPLPTRTCAFDGMPRAAWYPYPLQFVYAAGFVNILQHDVVRSIPVSGTQHAAELTDKTRLQGLDLYGATAGVWQGDTLVVDTIGVREDVDTFYGVPNDPDLQVVERYRLLPDGQLERITLVTSPRYFTAPWAVRTMYSRASEASWATRFCLPPIKVPAAAKGNAPRTAAGGPAPANARFTPNLSWDELLKLPRLWGVSWASTRSYDEQIVYVNRMTLIPPLKPVWLAKTQEFLLKSKSGTAEFRVGACYPNGVPRSGWYAYAPGFLFRPGNTLLITAWGETREIHMDGRPHPDSFDAADTATAYLGHSVGWWEGATLVVDTVGFAPQHELYYDVPNSGAMHVVERYRLLDAGHLELLLTVYDLDRLEKPWIVTHIYQAADLPDSTQASQGALRLDTQRCRPGMGREQLDSNGKSFVDLTPPPEGLGIGKGE
jgi:hypothetical protein